MFKKTFEQIKGRNGESGNESDFTVRLLTFLLISQIQNVYT